MRPLERWPYVSSTSLLFSLQQHSTTILGGNAPPPWSYGFLYLAISTHQPTAQYDHHLPSPVSLAQQPISSGLRKIDALLDTEQSTHWLATDEPGLRPITKASRQFGRKIQHRFIHPAIAQTCSKTKITRNISISRPRSTEDGVSFGIHYQSQIHFKYYALSTSNLNRPRSS